MIIHTREDLTRWRDVELKSAEERQERRDRYADYTRDCEAEVFLGRSEPNVATLTPKTAPDPRWARFRDLEARKEAYDSPFSQADRDEYWKLLFALYP